MEKFIYADSQKEAIQKFKKKMPKKYIADSAKLADEKHGVQVYCVYYHERRL